MWRFIYAALFDYVPFADLRPARKLGAGARGHHRRGRVTVSPGRFNAALGVLSRSNVPHGKLYRTEPDGRYVEVAG